jgi:hypothetical protein
VSASAFFSETYREARDKFRAALATAGGGLRESVRHPLRGPDGEDLDVDVGWVGPERPDRLLILVAGLHGVEGYCGSGCFVGWLARGHFARQAGPRTAVMMIHPINPWGMAHRRRVNENNVDLNRNFVPFDRPLPVNRPYADLAAHIDPVDWSPEAVALHDKAIRDYHGGADVGTTRLGKAVHGGQYINAKGTFFGGTEPQWSNVTMRRILRDHARGAKDVALIDYHSGHGPFGYYELFIEDSFAGRQTRSWFDDVVAIADDKAQHGENAQSATPGNMIYSLPEELPDARTTPCLTELRWGPQSALPLVREENWFVHHGDGSPARSEDYRRRMQALFSPADPLWRAMVLAQSNARIGEALAGLAEGD